MPKDDPREALINSLMMALDATRIQPWWLTFKTSIPPDEINGKAPPGEIAWITKL